MVVILDVFMFEDQGLTYRFNRGPHAVRTPGPVHGTRYAQYHGRPAPLFKDRQIMCCPGDRGTRPFKTYSPSSTSLSVSDSRPLHALEIDRYAIMSVRG
jgi:hypothetical protein